MKWFPYQNIKNLAQRKNVFIQHQEITFIFYKISNMSLI